MKLETYVKMIIIVGVATACIMVSIVLSYSLGDILRIHDIGDKIQWALVDKDEIKQQMMETLSYQSFIERFPDHRVEITDNYNRLYLLIEAINPTTMNLLQLTINYSLDMPRLRENLDCNLQSDNMGKIFPYETAFTDVFIKNTDCLEDDFKLSLSKGKFVATDRTLE